MCGRLLYRSWPSGARKPRSMGEHKRESTLDGRVGMQEVPWDASGLGGASEVGPVSDVHGNPTPRMGAECLRPFSATTSDFEDARGDKFQLTSEIKHD